MEKFASIEPLEPRIAPATLTVTNLNDSGNGSLRAALAITHDGDDIVFQSGLQGLIHVKSKMQIVDSISLNGGGKITLDGGKSTAVLNIVDFDQSNQVSVSGLTFRNAKGGAISIAPYQVVTVQNCSFIGNVSYGGGAIYASGAALTIIGSTFSNNTGYQGGAIFANVAGLNPSLLVRSCYFSANLGISDGAAIAVYANKGSCTIDQTRFYKDNGMTDVSIHASSTATVTLSNSSISGFWASESTLSSALSIGGEDGNPQFVVKNTILENNHNGLYGTIVINGRGTTLIDHCNIKNNFSTNAGGGISVRPQYYSNDDSGPIVMITGTAISGNTAPLGGGIVAYAGTIILDQSTVLGNKAIGLGGSAGFGAGIQVTGANLTIDHSTIASNVAIAAPTPDGNLLAGHGGGIADSTAFSDGTIMIIASTIKGNNPDQIFAGTFNGN